MARRTGPGATGEFIRAQCELAAGTSNEAQRKTLQTRERQLLDQHRQDWCRAFGLPLEDVAFDRGLIAKMRLAQWDDGRILAPDSAPRFATLTELDLSGLRLGDRGLATFAEHACFPALRKLILCDNDITNTGVVALSAAKGLPKIRTIHLTKNSLDENARLLLKGAGALPLETLDTGERAEGYCLSPAEADLARRRYLRTAILPLVTKYFRENRFLQSAVFCVAQYWDDEANDAVHAMLIVSEWPVPILEGLERHGRDPNIPNTPLKSPYREEPTSQVGLWDAGVAWNHNMGAIPLWAAFAPEGGHQNYENVEEAFAPAAMFYRHGGYVILPMSRPALDGIRPEWGTEDDE